MTHGRSTTLVINPTGKSSLTMAVTGASVYDDTTPYLVPLQSIRIHEEDRLEAIYAEGGSGEGGRPVGSRRPLVPFEFDVLIIEDTKANMISAYNDLQAALLNPPGGTVKFKPDELGAGVIDTYYHYVRSRPPRLIQEESNRWDAGAKADGMFVMQVQCEFMTQPAGTSDPDNPVTLTEMTDTLENWDDATEGQSHQLTVTAANVKGSLPALLRILARPGSGQHLGRLIIFKRDEGTLANFQAVYEAEDASAIYPSVAWSEVSDNDRGDDKYMKCFPAEDANGVAQGLRFTISNPDDHEGRFAVFGVGYDDADDAEGLGIWTHQVQLVCGSIIQEGKEYESQMLHGWHLIYCGEFELPPTRLSGVESAYDSGPYVDWYSTRASGASEFRLDAIILVYVASSDDEAVAIDVPCEDEDGVTNSEKLLLENFPGDHGLLSKLSHVVAQSDEDLKRVLTLRPRGDFITLDPMTDTLLVFIQEQTAYTTILEDNFSSYIESRFIVADGMEAGWTGGHNDFYEVEGDKCISLNVDADGNLEESEKSVSMDLENEGRFGDGDFMCAFVRCANPSPDYCRWRFYDGSDYFHYSMVPDGDAATFITRKKQDFAEFGTPDWTNIDKLWVGAAEAPGGDTCTLYFDYWRLEKADPDDADNPNATGSQWDFQPVGGHWTITADAGSGSYVLACLDVEAGVEKSALIDETTPDDVQFRARVMAKRDAGYVGILWRAGDDTLTEGAEDCYAALLDVANDDLLVREYANGAVTQHDNPDFTSVVDTWYVVGVIVKGSTFKVYATAASNLSDDDDVFSSSYLLSTVTDATLTSGKCGVMSISTLGRFDEVKLVSLRDKVVPADTIAVEGKAIFRTIAPFCE